MQYVSNDHVLTYEDATTVLVTLNAGLGMIKDGYIEKGLEAVKKAQYELRIARNKGLRAKDVTEAYIRYLQAVTDSE